jgi:hypothetical protein
MRPPTERFESKVDRSPGHGPNGDCHVWVAGTDRDGYGRVRPGGSVPIQRAHRVAWFLAHGVWPELCVLHRCDNPPCVNPRHLFLGTNADNTADRDRKRRHADRRGTANATAKLVDSDVLAIRGAVGTQREIAAEYNVSASTVSLIKSGRRWTHLKDMAC